MPDARDLKIIIGLLVGGSCAPYLAIEARNGESDLSTTLAIACSCRSDEA